MNQWKIAVLIAACLYSCAAGRTLHQGIRGEVIWFEGNRMPGTGKPPPPGKPVERTIYIYSLTSRENAASEDGIFYHDIKSALIKKIRSKSSGQFSTHLGAGIYSVFVKEDRGLYANLFDDNSNINPVQVNHGAVTELSIRIDYHAAY